MDSSGVEFLGAEAKVVVDESTVAKTRLSKAYRIPEIDRKLTKHRVKTEIKILKKLEKADISAPRFIRQQDATIYMERIKGIPLRNVLNDENQEELLGKVGKIVAKLHSENIIHGDLTTMNFLVDCNSAVFVIDFGLSFFSAQDEDKAVDLYVFEKALRCVHSADYASSFYNGYSNKENESVMNRLLEVRLRGRKREEE